MILSRDPLGWMAVARDLIAFVIAAGTGVAVWYRRRSARFWPIAYGKVEHASALENGGTWLADISYSYTVSNEFYAGQHQIKARNEQRADDLVAQWKGQSVGVRYSPKNPQVSVVRMEDQSSLHPGEFRGH